MNRAAVAWRRLRWLVAPAAVWAIYWMRGNVWYRLYPAVMVAMALAVFAVSLWRTPLVEVFARKMGAPLDQRGLAYCRDVTRVWTAFLTMHLAVTLATVFASHEVWVIYNGLIAYLLMGAMFLGEWLYRQRKLRNG